MSSALEDRFWSKVDRAGECWLWKASCTRNGYGQFSISRAMRAAHRVAYEISVGPIPDGLVIDHLCRVKKCVRPEHLEAVTQRVNILRGEAPPALGAKATHCPSGHPLSGGNLYLAPRSGKRHCKECRRAQHRAYYWRKKGGVELVGGEQA